MTGADLLLVLGVGIAAALYASVGHGGASGYLALLALVGRARPEVATTVLLLNLLVSGLAFHRYRARGHHEPGLTLPFVLFSAPAAFLGGTLRVAPELFSLLVGGALVVAAARFLLPHPVPRGDRRPGGGTFLAAAAGLGIGLGLLAGMTGVGGGIYLSPLLLLLRWADAKGTAATASAFILVNSAAGLAGRLAVGQGIEAGLLPLVGAALVGGWLGARFGADRARSRMVVRLLGVVLLVAGGKLLLG